MKLNDDQSLEGALEGEITSIDTATGIGVISLSKSEAKEAGKNELFFQVADLAPGTEITDLNIGTRVSLNAAMGENGPHASAVSKEIGAASADRQEHREVSGPITGEIQKLNEKGTGFIRLNSGEVLLFHAKDLSGVTFDDLHEGDTVQIGDIDKIDANIRRASNITMGAETAVVVQAEKQNTATSACIERLAASKPAVEKVLENANIIEVRIIEKPEALKYLVISALADGIDLDSLVLIEIHTNQAGQLVKLEAKATEPNGNFKLLTYQIKLDDQDKHALQTNVDVCSYDKDSEYPRSADEVAQFVDGKWRVLDNSKPAGQKWVAQK